MDRLLEDVNTYKMENKEPEKTMLEKKGAMKAMTRSLVDLKMRLIHLGMESSLLIKKMKSFFLSCREQDSAAVGLWTSF